MLKIRSIFRFYGFILICLAVKGTYSAEVQIPKQSDWTDHGTIIQAGASGSWDYRFVGGFSPCAAIKKNGTYFVYYIGARGGRSDDNGPAYRALGVFTSTDGINWQKHPQNPVIKHWKGISDPQEAGVFTAGGLLDNGEFLMYAGVMTEFSRSSVNDDGKLYVAQDGYNFSYVATVLDHTDHSKFGYGDEFDPFGVFKHPTNGTWHMYYSAGTSGWSLGYQAGPSRDNFTSSAGIITSGDDIIGGCDPIFLGPEKIVLFIDRANGSPRWSHWYTEARTASINSPKNLSSPVVTYDFSNTMGTAIYLDKEAGKWFMFYNQGVEQFTNNPGTGTTIGLRTAPVIYNGSTKIKNGKNDMSNMKQIFYATPNPFFRSTTLRFRLLRPQRIKLEILDTMGRNLGTWVEEKAGPGLHSTVLNGQELCSGVYLARLQIGNASFSKKLFLVK